MVAVGKIVILKTISTKKDQIYLSQDAVAYDLTGIEYGESPPIVLLCLEDKLVAGEVYGSDCQGPLVIWKRFGPLY